MRSYNLQFCFKAGFLILGGPLFCVQKRSVFENGEQHNPYNLSFLATKIFVPCGVTEAVNNGKTTLEDAFKKLVKRDSKGRIDYSYSDGFDGFRYGQKLLCFCDIETVAQHLGI